MAQLLFTENFNADIASLDAAMALIHQEKTQLILESLGMFTPEMLAVVLAWDKIEIGVCDRALCIQLNRIAKNVPKLQFVMASDAPLLILVH